MADDYYKQPDTPRTMENWRNGSLVNNQETLRKRVAEGDLDAEAQLKALKLIKRAPRASS